MKKSVIYASDIIKYKAMRKEKRDKIIADIICFIIASLPFAIAFGVMFTVAYWFIDLAVKTLF